MDLRFSEAQEILRKSARDFLNTECPKTSVRELEQSERGYSPELWKKMAELGWISLAIPEAYEGMGYSFQDLTVLLEEVGRSALPGPLLSTITSTFFIVDAGNEEQKTEFLPSIGRGELILTTALYESEGTLEATGISLKAESKGNDYALSGTKLFVEMAHVADYIICAAKTDSGTSPEQGITIFIVDAKSPGMKCEVMPTTAFDKQCEVSFDNVVVPNKNVLGATGKGWSIIEKILRKGAICKCAESVGGMQAAFEMTVAYSKERVQYDRPIGAFQALQHIMADMMIAVNTSRYLLYEAAWMESEGLTCAKEASMVKSYVNEAYKNLTKWVVRLHGGIGTSGEHDAPIYYRKAKSADYAFGSTDFHRELVAQKIGLI